MNRLEFKSEFGLLSPRATELDKPMTLKDVRFGAIPVKGISIMEGTNDISSGFIGEVLEYMAKERPEYADKEIKDANYFFDMFVIRL